MTGPRPLTTAFTAERSPFEVPPPSTAGAVPPAQPTTAPSDPRDSGDGDPNRSAVGERQNRGLIIALAAVAAAVLVAAAIVVIALKQSPAVTATPPAPTTATTASAPTTVAPTAAPSTTIAATTTDSTSETEPSKKGLPAAVAAMQQQGFTPSDTSTWSDNRPLNALPGTPAGAGSGQLAQWFFFVDGKPVGTDSLIAHTGAGEVESVTDDTVTLKYGILRDSDPLCCPSGGTQRVTYTWDGSKLNATGDPPPTTTSTPRRAAVARRTTDNSVRQRTGASTTSAEGGPSFERGTVVDVECQVIGSFVSIAVDSDAGSEVWNRLTRGTYVSDNFLDTKKDLPYKTQGLSLGMYDSEIPRCT